MIDFSFSMRLGSGLPVDVEGTYEGRNSFSWMAEHVCKDEIYTFGEGELGVSDQNMINREVIEYCEKVIEEKEWEND